VKKNEKVIPSEPVKTIPGLLFLLRAKKFLKSFYSLSSSKCQSYESSDLKMNPLTNKIQIENIDCLKHMPLDDPLYEGTWWENTEKVYDVYTLFKLEMKNDEDDINVNTISTMKKPRLPRKKRGRNSNDEEDNTTKQPKKKQKPIGKKVTRKKKYDDSEDDIEIESSDGDYAP